LEVYVEPVLPQPHLVVIGRSPAVGTLASMAGALGWRAVVVDEGGLAEDYPGADLVLTSLELSDADVTERSVIVVATQGHYDEAALEAALATPAAYVGLVASRTRADAVVGYLRDRGASDDQLARVHAPAGLDLGKIAHEAIDPVCGMTVDIASAVYRSTFEDTTYYFCSAGCLARFEEDPARFAAAVPG
jgi:xanthine dehydrogenase accessory factor